MERNVTQLMISLAACVTGFILDFIFGDPAWIYHPVRIIGKGIELGERLLRRISGEKHLTAAGAVLWLMIAGLSFLFPLGILLLAWKIHPGLCFALESFWCFQILAARSLCRESGKVYDRLQENDLPGARRAVSMIVGRDTESLTEEGVTKAAVETVAENTSDGVTAPLIYLMIGGAPLGFLYKAVNTMDSMLGYKNDRYLYFGRVPAGMDDIFNYIPARLTALLMIAAAYLTGLDGKNAWRIFRRDRKNHKSPNSAHTEAACAGALQLQLAGPSCYFGKLVDKPTIGDDQRPIEALDILRAGRILYATAFFALLLFCGVPLMILLFP